LKLARGYAPYLVIVLGFDANVFKRIFWSDRRRIRSCSSGKDVKKYYASGFIGLSGEREVAGKKTTG